MFWNVKIHIRCSIRSPKIQKVQTRFFWGLKDSEIGLILIKGKNGKNLFLQNLINAGDDDSKIRIWFTVFLTFSSYILKIFIFFEILLLHDLVICCKRFSKLKKGSLVKFTKKKLTLFSIIIESWNLLKNKLWRALRNHICSGKIHLVKVLATLLICLTQLRPALPTLHLHKKWSFPLRISSVKLRIWSHLLKKSLKENF